MRAVSGRRRPRAWLARAFGLDGNPLRRPIDRAEAWIRAGLLAVLLTVGPLAALGAGQWAAHTASAGTSVQPHAVHAVLLHAAAAAPAPAFRSQVLVRARWENAGGSVRTGEVPAPAGAPAGAVVTVWLDSSGRVTGPPQPDESTSAAVLAAVTTLAVIALALLVTLRLIQRFLNWRRLAAWETAWQAIGPRWTGHRS